MKECLYYDSFGWMCPDYDKINKTCSRNGCVIDEFIKMAQIEE